MSFREYYQSLKYQPTPAAIFIREIATLCNRAEITVRKWLAGDTMPEAELQERIAAHLNMTVEELFMRAKCNTKRMCDGNNRT